MQKSTIIQIADYLKSALNNLGKDISNPELERIVLMIHQCMRGGRRMFHTSEHILKICSRLEYPTQILAALFHDIVYHQADGDFPKPLVDTIKPYFDWDDDGATFLESVCVQDFHIGLLLDVFDVSYEKKYTVYNGLNELLSALSAVKTLEPYLTSWELMEVMAYIEATIPFRPDDEDGQDFFYQIEHRLTKINDKHRLALTPESIVEIVKRCVQIANVDVVNFSDTEVGVFLDNTWKLLPETNQELFSVRHYSVKSYRKALVKMEKFLAQLKAEQIFHQYRGYPSEQEYLEFKNRAVYNLKVALEYIQAKIVAIAMIEAFAMCSGGDAPISMFLGDIKRQEGFARDNSFEEHLPFVTISEDLNYVPEVLYLLKHGRNSYSEFDIRNAPISYFIYANLGQEQIPDNLNLANAMFEGELTCEEYLNQIQPSIRSAIARSLALVAMTRRNALMGYFEEI